jgi:L-2-hydroxyglutarate oxidase LhgO
MTVTEQADCVVIGAGVVGLAVARRLAMAGREVIILEAEGMIGTGTSSRNSEVIHAGIYYPTGSLKARSCVAGKEALYAYCAERGIPHRRAGKLIVAASEAQQATLHQIRAKAAANGVADLAWLSAGEVRELEPEVVCTAALLSPSTGIIDSHALMLAYQGDAEDHGAMLAVHSPVTRGRVDEDGITLEVGDAGPSAGSITAPSAEPGPEPGPEPDALSMSLRARIVVNSAGLHAPEVAARLQGLPPEMVPKAHFCRGNYFTLSGARPFTHLVYPVPEDAGLGVHVTLDLGGQVRFGPDVEWIDGIDYGVDPTRSAVFYEAIRRYYPALRDGALEPGYAGIRPKIGPAGSPAADFVVQGPDDHGVPGLVNLFAIESPGLTASLALAEQVELALHRSLSWAA